MSVLARSGTWFLAFAVVAGCSESHSTGADGGRADGGDGVIRDCIAAGSAPAGSACEPFGICHGDGICGDSITWRCIDGALDIERTAPIPGCGDAGTDGGAADGGMCAPSPPTSGTGCRSDADCTSGVPFEQCIAPGEFAGCGPCFPPMRLCESDADCVSADGTTGFCVSYIHPCTPPTGGCGTGGDPTSTMCVPRCLDDMSCAEGEACGSDGRCAPIACDAGYACPTGTVCEPSAGATDAHGCRRLSCATDADCPCRSGCVEGACHDTLGVCEPPRA